jgi:hypothetical protein
VRICNAVENWLAADDDNVAVVHCRTGRRRTCTVLACLMAWLGQSPDPMKAMRTVAQVRNIPIAGLTIPSQRRYIRYFDRVLKGDQPSSSPQTLQRIIVNTVPDFTEGAEADGKRGCRAEMQLLQHGKLLWCSSGHDKDTRSRDASKQRLYVPEDGSMSFSVEIEVQADVVLRCSHIAVGVDATAAGSEAGEQSAAATPPAPQKTPVFRTAFSCGYVTSGILRLARDELDGVTKSDTRCVESVACTTHRGWRVRVLVPPAPRLGSQSSHCEVRHRFQEDFFVDVIFGPTPEVSRPFPSWNRSILTEIYLCHACSCQEILRTETAGPGYAAPESADTAQAATPEEGVWDHVDQRRTTHHVRMS